MNKSESIALAKNKQYKTYQFFGEIISRDSSKRGNEILRICIIEIFAWLRGRFRECDIPNEIKISDSKHYQQFTDRQISSFRIEEGYIVDVIYIEDQGVWACHLIEPDKGNDSREAIIGRTFETNIAFKIVGDHVECGFKIICAEPEYVVDECKVFRPKFVRTLAHSNHLILKHIKDFSKKAFVIKKDYMVDDLFDFVKNEKRQTNIVVVTQKQEIVIEETDEEFKEETEVEKILPIDVNRLANSLIGYAFVYFIEHDCLEAFKKIFNRESFRDGDVMVIYPDKSAFEKNRIFKYEQIVAHSKVKTDGMVAFVDNLKEELMCYTKRNEYITYGNVMFLLEARNKMLQHKKDVKDTVGENKRLNERVSTLEKQLKNSKKNAHDQENQHSKVPQLECDLKDRKDEVKECKITIKQLHKTIDINNRLARDHYIKRLEWPHKFNQINDWVNREFSNSIVLLPKAVTMLENCKKEIDINDLCDGIYFLGTIYHQYKTGVMVKDEYDNIFNPNCWEVALSGPQSIKLYKNQYSVNYNGKRQDLKFHIKKGRENNHLIRIYFFYHKEHKKIVIGSLPEHLETRS